jgi:DNA-binding NarL/FixJ family response regulator
MSFKAIIADNQAVFRTGAARLLAVEEDFRIVGQCDDLARLYQAAEKNVGALILCASSLQPDLAQLLARAKPGNNAVVMVLENAESPEPSVKAGVRGVVFRDVGSAELIKCLRSIGRGGTHLQQRSSRRAVEFETDIVGERARERLTPKELRIVSLIVQGYKNKDIAAELNNTEQVIKNYLRSIFDKTGVSDRLELALFTIHHRVLAESPHEATNKPAKDISSPQRGSYT